ncbi:MAG: heat shock protein Hsp20 [Labilithrix sp.]|nr:heat shock protein Hsp20 [Labilithrix sp.]
MASRWDPFAEIAWRPADTSAAGQPWFAPAIDIFEDDESFVVKVELPGLRPEDVDVDIDEHVMTIRGERKPENVERREGYHRRERSYGVFSRTFALPDEAFGSDAVAVMAEGVLTVRIPKREPDSLSPSSLDPMRRAS